MYAFNEETLRYLLEKIKAQLDKKKIVEYFLEESDEENALVIGDDEIDEALVEKSGFSKGTKVIKKEMVLTEVEFTAEEKKALNTSMTDKSSDNILEDWMGNLFFDLITYEEYNFRKFGGNADFDLSKFYIVSDNIEEDKPATIVFVDKYITRDKQVKNFTDNKVNVDGDKVLSEEDFTDERKAIADELMANIDSILTNDSIKDNLESAEGVLSANQGRILKDEYCGGEPFDFYLPEDEVYGLTDAQVAMLNKSYSNSLFNKDMTFAKRKEILDARKNYDSLSERINAIEKRLKTAAHNIDFADNVSGYYGVQFDFEEQTYTRLGKCKTGNFDECYPWAGMKRCNIVNGEVVAYENDENYKEDGSNGDVMVEIPKFWYKVIPVKTEPSSSLIGDQLLNAKWLISNKNANGFKVHPAFIRNNQEVDHIYVSAFEGCIYSMSSKNYLYEDEQIMNSDVDKLCSISGAKPATGTTQNLSITNFRRLAKNKGNNYGLLDFTTMSALQLLFLIEHASFNVQEKIGQGITNSDTLVKTGHSDAVTYRGIENLWGNIWCFIEGINVELNNQEHWSFAYWSNDSDKNDTADEHTKINFKLCRETYGYIDRFGYDQNNDFVFLPTRITGSEAIAPHDIYNHNTTSLGWVVPIFGGKWNSENGAGLWAYSIYDASSYHGFNISSRVMFYK